MSENVDPEAPRPNGHYHRSPASSISYRISNEIGSGALSSSGI